ncbi:MAG: hypothetical protein OEZ43_07485 [Gammaproteobacteria bacterium]|nr:hypothetical protein [Gammaproteobacteria bacterium]
MNHKVFVALLSIIISGCVAHPAWNQYRSAQSCHFKKQEDCSEYYEKAIKYNERLPGVHSSYGTYLITKGHINQGIEEINTEIRHHPYSENAMKLILEKYKKND